MKESVSWAGQAFPVKLGAIDYHLEAEVLRHPVVVAVWRREHQTGEFLGGLSSRLMAAIDGLAEHEITRPLTSSVVRRGSGG